MIIFLDISQANYQVNRFSLSNTLLPLQFDLICWSHRISARRRWEWETSFFLLNVPFYIIISQETCIRLKTRWWWDEPSRPCFYRIPSDVVIQTYFSSVLRLSMSMTVIILYMIIVMMMIMHGSSSFLYTQKKLTTFPPLDLKEINQNIHTC